MHTRFKIQRQVAVFAAALLVSSFAVGAAIGPGAAQARPLIAVTYA